MKALPLGRAYSVYTQAPPTLVTRVIGAPDMASAGSRLSTIAPGSSRPPTRSYARTR